MYYIQIKQNSKIAVLNFNFPDFEHLSISNNKLGRIFEYLTETLKIASDNVRVTNSCML